MPSSMPPVLPPSRRAWRARVATRAARAITALVATLAATACLTDSEPTAPGGPTTGGPSVQAAVGLNLPPGNLAIAPDGRRFVSLHQNFDPPRQLIEVDAQGNEVTFPRAGQDPLPPLVAVLGVRVDTAGVLWILDNGDQGRQPSKIVAYDTRAGRLLRTFVLAPPVIEANSWINDLDFDYPNRKLYISDPAGGPNAALLVVDMMTGDARRVLRGHASVIPTDTTWTVSGKPLVELRPDGSRVRPVIGVDGLVLDAAREWLYYGALDGRTMWRIRAADLANPALDDAALGARVERYATKPPSDGLRMDQGGNIYLGDLERNAIGVIAADRSYRELARGDAAVWIDDFEFGTDGTVYIVDTQLHLSPPLDAGQDRAQRPFIIYRMAPLAQPPRIGF